MTRCDKRVHGIRIANRLTGVCCAALLVTTPVMAAPWDFGMTVDLGVIYTDNLFLSPEGSEIDDTVWTIVPEFSLETDGDRLDASIFYRPEAFFYSDNSEFDDIFHVFDGEMTAEMVSDAFFLYLSGVRYQASNGPGGNFPTSNIPVTANRVDSTILEARPYWQQRFGNVDLLAEVSYTDIAYDDIEGVDPTLSEDSNERRARLDINNQASQQMMTWGLNYDYRRMEYETATPWEFQRAFGELGVWLSSSVRVFGVGGVETPFDQYFSADMDDSFWEAGFQYRPNSRLDMEFAAGERSYGDSYRGRFSYQLRRGTSELTYDEGPSSRGETVIGRRPIVDTDQLDNILDRIGNSDRFIQRRGEWVNTLDLSRSDLSLRLFVELREDRTEADGTPLEDEQYAGVAFRWSWDMGRRTTLGLEADYAEREIGDENDELTRFELQLTYQLSSRLSLRAFAMRSEENDDNQPLASYVENQFRLILSTEIQ